MISSKLSLFPLALCLNQYRSGDIENVLESEHWIKRLWFLRLREKDLLTDEKLHDAQSLGMSDKLYGSDIMSAYKLSHGFKNPISDKTIRLPEDIFVHKKH